MVTHSVYAIASFFVAGGVLIGLATILTIVAAVLIFNLTSNTSRVVAFVVAGLVTTAQMLMTLFFALLSGYNFLPAPVTFVISSLLWIPTVMFGMTMLGSAWRSAFLITKVMKQNAESSGGAYLSKAGAVTAKMGGFCAALRSLATSVFVVAMRQPLLYWISSVASFTFTLCIVLIMDGICYCTNPSHISTWVSRRNEPKVCLLDDTCHVYSLLGTNSSRLRVVGHFQASDDRPPADHSVTACEADLLSRKCIGPIWQLRSRMLDLADLSEDRRYVAQGFANNLSGSTVYQFSVSFTAATGTFSSKSITIRTVPSDNSTSDITFIGGGDYHSSSIGLELLSVALQRMPKPMFLFIGGDLSYANNLRTCYLRWDRYLNAMATLITSEGLHISLMTIPGNHESGGYLTESDPTRYHFYTPFMPQFDVDDGQRGSALEDYTTTFHSHAIGNRVGLIGLDSNCMVAIEAQNDFLRDRIIAFRGIDATDPQQSLSQQVINRMRFVIVMYHNPAYPVLTSFDDSGDDDPTPLVAKHWVPIMDAQKVPVALEFHEHVYKRTKPLFRGSPVPFQIGAQGGAGIVFLGDGALGVFKGRKISETDFVQVSKGINYINCLTVFASNGSLRVESIDEDGVLQDSALLHLRLA